MTCCRLVDFGLPDDVGEKSAILSWQALSLLASSCREEGEKEQKFYRTVLARNNNPNSDAVGNISMTNNNSSNQQFRNWRSGEYVAPPWDGNANSLALWKGNPFW